MSLFSAIEIEINHACNRSCAYCPNSVGQRKSRGRLDPEIYASLLRQLGAFNYAGRLSYHFYNEPLLHPRLAELVAEARAQVPRVRIELYTNGTLLTAPTFARLRQAGVDQFIVTRQAEDMGRDYAFAATWASLSPEARKSVQYRTHEELMLSNRGGKLSEISVDPRLRDAACFIPAMIVTVTVSGNVLPCFEDFDEAQVMGNLRDQSLLEIWRSEKYARFRAELALGLRARHLPCLNCSRMQSLPTEDFRHV